MDVIRQQLQRIQEQLGGLSASQKMLTASLVVIMGMTIVWWGRYASTAEMAPLLDQPMSGDDVARLTQAIRAAGIPFQVNGDRVMIPTTRQGEALAAAGYARALPANSSNGFDEIIKQVGPFETDAITGAKLNRGREMTLIRMISGWPGVADASVIISEASRRKIGGGGDIEPSATATINTRGGDANRKQIADAAAAAIASSTPGLSPGRVSVIIDGRRVRTHDDGDHFSGETYEQIAQQEKHFQQKIEDVLSIPNARVAVRVAIDTTRSEERRRTYDPKGTFTKEKSIEQETTESAEPASGALEPGAQANIGLSNEEPTAPATATNTSERSRTDMEVFASESQQTIHRPGGEVSVVSVAVRVPLSYYQNWHQKMTGSAEVPTEADLKPLLDEQFARIKQHVLNAAGLRSEEVVSVDAYWDDMPLLAATGDATVAAAKAGGGVGAMITSHVKEIAVGALAVVSLFMVMSMVKKGTPAPVMAPPPELHEVPALASEEDVAGEVGEGGSMLDGMELDEDAIKAQQMVEQVSTLVKENPDGAANLVKRWLNK